MPLGAKMKEQEERSLRHAEATVRLGFWAPVYGNWIVSKHPEAQNASFDYTRKLTLLAEDIGFATILLAEHTFNPFISVGSRTRHNAWRPDSQMSTSSTAVL